MSSLHVNRTFSIPVEQLYTAWTEPDSLKQWWKPMGQQLKEVVNELRESGNIRYVFEEGLVIEGSYEKVEPNQLLVYSWNWNFTKEPIAATQFRLHIHFNQAEEGSTIEIKQEGFENEEHVKPHETGWQEGLDQLAAFVQKNSDSSGIAASQQDGKPPISGYNETPEQVKVGGG